MWHYAVLLHTVRKKNAVCVRMCVYIRGVNVFYSDNVFTTRLNTCYKSFCCLCLYFSSMNFHCDMLSIIQLKKYWSTWEFQNWTPLYLSLFHHWHTVNSFLKSCVGGVYYWNDLQVWFRWVRQNSSSLSHPTWWLPNPSLDNENLPISQNVYFFWDSPETK